MSDKNVKSLYFVNAIHGSNESKQLSCIAVTGQERVGRESGKAFLRSWYSWERTSVYAGCTVYKGSTFDG